MHVAIVSPYDPRPDDVHDPQALRGGVEESLDRTAAGLAARGHDVTVVTSATRDGVSVSGDGVRFVRVRRRGMVFRTPIAPLWRHIPETADVVHVPATYPLVSDLIPRRESARGRPVVLDYHFDPYGTSGLMRIASVLHRATIGRWMYRSDRIITKSLDYARHSHALRDVPKGQLDLVPNGVDVDRFVAKETRGRDLLCVGRLVPYKGVEVLLRAMPQIHAETGAHLDIVGSGPEEARLHATADRLGAAVRFHGRVPDEALPGFFARARVTVLPSVNRQEAFGMTLVESMCAGTPVVASALPGVREVASLAGFIARPNDAADLAERVIDAWHDPQRFGSPEAIRERAANRFSWPVVLDRLEPVYHRALESRSAPHTRATRRATGGAA